MSNKQIVYLSLIASVLVVNVIFIVYTLRRPFAEHFTEQEEDQLKSFIFKAFDERHHKNPTVTQVEKYASLKTKDAILQEMDQELKQPIAIVIDETVKPSVTQESDDKNKGIFSKALKDTLQLIDTAKAQPNPEPESIGDVTFSKTFIQTKIVNIQRQLDDLKRLL